MKILVLGANGQVGSELGAQLDSLARLEGERFTVVFANRSSVDVTNLDSLKSFLGHHEPKWVINATAYTAVDSAESEVSKAYSVNEHAVRVLANYCATNDANLIHISTDYVLMEAVSFRFTKKARWHHLVFMAHQSLRVRRR